MKSKTNNDRVGSIKLAKVHLVNMMSESHLLDDAGRIELDLLVQRAKLGKSIASLKTGIIGYLKREGVFDSLPRGSDNFSAKRRKAMADLRFGNQMDLVFTIMMDRLSFYEQQVFTREQEIRKNARVSEDIRLLMTIPRYRLLPRIPSLTVYR